MTLFITKRNRRKKTRRNIIVITITVTEINILGVKELETETSEEVVAEVNHALDVGSVVNTVNVVETTRGVAEEEEEEMVASLLNNISLE